VRLVEVVGCEADEARISHFYKWERFKRMAVVILEETKPVSCQLLIICALLTWITESRAREAHRLLAVGGTRPSPAEGDPFP